MGLGEHVKGISCEHGWAVYREADRKNPPQFTCNGCGSLAVFDERGKIVEYDRTFNWGNPLQLDGQEEPQPKQRRQEARR